MGFCSARRFGRRLFRDDAPSDSPRVSPRPRPSSPGGAASHSSSAASSRSCARTCPSSPAPPTCPTGVSCLERGRRRPVVRDDQWGSCWAASRSTRTTSTCSSSSSSRCRSCRGHRGLRRRRAGRTESPEHEREDALARCRTTVSFLAREAHDRMGEAVSDFLVTASIPYPRAAHRGGLVVVLGCNCVWVATSRRCTGGGDDGGHLRNHAADVATSPSEFPTPCRPRCSCSLCGGLRPSGSARRVVDVPPRHDRSARAATAAVITTFAPEPPPATSSPLPPNSDTSAGSLLHRGHGGHRGPALGSPLVPSSILGRLRRHTPLGRPIADGLGVDRNARSRIGSGTRRSPWRSCAARVGAEREGAVLVRRNRRHGRRRRSRPPRARPPQIRPRTVGHRAPPRFRAKKRPSAHPVEPGYPCYVSVRGSWPGYRHAESRVQPTRPRSAPTRALPPRSSPARRSGRGAMHPGRSSIGRQRDRRSVTSWNGRSSRSTTPPCTAVTAAASTSRSSRSVSLTRATSKPASSRACVRSPSAS